MVRIVSLLPSATEIVCALGGRAELVGRSSECDFPDSVRDVPIVMRPRTDDFDRSSREIDERVRSARSRSESLYRLDVEALTALRPDVLLTQDLCSVCSVTGTEVEAACRAAGIRPEIVSLAPRTLSDVWGTIPTVGAAISRPTEAEGLARELGRRSAPEATPGSGRPRVAVVEWVDPPILAGLWVAEMVARAGGVHVGPLEGTPGERVEWDELARRSPDLVVVSPCSFSVERAQQELSGSGPREGLSGLRPNLGIWVADEAFFSRPGPRLALGIDLLRGLIGGGNPRVGLPYARWDRAGPVG